MTKVLLKKYLSQAWVKFYFLCKYNFTKKNYSRPNFLSKLEYFELLLYAADILVVTDVCFYIYKFDS